MRKQIMGILLTLCMVLALMPSTALAAGSPCVFDSLTGKYHIVSSKGFSGTPADTFKVGERFENIRATIGYYYSGANEAHFGYNPKWWLNGMPLQEGYVFDQVGYFTLTLQCEMTDSEYKGWKTAADKAGVKFPSSKTAVCSMRIGVLPDVDWQNISEFTLASSMSQTSYRQGADAFDPTSIIVRAGIGSYGEELAYQNLDWDDLTYYAGSRGMKYKEHGSQITKGYRFWVPGEKDLWVVVGNKSIVIPFTVTPFVSSVEVIDEPDAGSSTFSTGDYSVKTNYKDGTSEVLSGDCLNISVGGQRMYQGGEYVIPSSTSTVKISMGDFSVEQKVTASEKVESTPSTSTSPDANATVIESGEYYMKIGDRWVYPDKGYNYWLILSEKKPDKPFKVTLVGEDKEEGPEYTIEYWDRYVVCSNLCAADLQLHADINKLTYRINTYPKSGFSTIRVYDNQSYLVKGTGSGVFAEVSKGSAPDLSKVVFIKPNALSDAPSPTIAPSATVTAKQTKTAFMLNGAEVNLPAYSINENNYVKLRDVGALLKTRFDVRWEDGKAKLYNKMSYNFVGGELENIDATDKTAQSSTTNFVWGDTGDAVTGLTAYTIGGNNYIKLRDIAKLFDFDVDWRDGKAWIEPNVSPYTED
ncbi:MAG: hypothetical protein PHE51_02405 [Eubacteriales bacterium]|nr:hypothetical protein [Eubacteriales bacterium]